MGRVTALLLILSPALAWAQDYRLESTEWNGLSELLQIANQEEVPVDTAASIDISALSPSDALLVLYPQDDLPRASLSAFLRAGGRIALADDFGEGEEFLEVYGIRRGPAPAGDVPRMRGNPQLLVAQPRMRHPLSDGVRTLVTNHPSTVRHAELEPVLTFGESDTSGVVLTGAVEEGRLVVLSDPSVLINNMLQFRDNRRFAANLLRYLHGGRAGRVFIATPNAELIGQYGQPGGAPVERLRSWLDDLAHAEAPPVALSLMAIVLVAILAVFAVSSLPLQSPYDAEAIRPPRTFGGGFAGRVRFFGRRPRDLIHPLMVYKFELEGELMRRLDLSGQPLLRDVLAAAKRHGAPPAEVQRLRALLVELNDLRQRLDLPPAPPRVGRDRFRKLVAEGEWLLSRLGKREAAA